MAPDLIFVTAIIGRRSSFHYLIIKPCGCARLPYAAIAGANLWCVHLSRGSPATPLTERPFQSADRPPVSLPEQVLELVTHSLPSSDNLDPPPAYIFNRDAISRLQDTLLSSIRSEDLSFIHSLLFSPAIAPSSPSSLYPMSVPVLVNLPDKKGWGLIHHAVSNTFPSVDVLNALYCAGADMALFTVDEQWTPLHILAQSKHLSFDDQDHTVPLYELVVHLIRNLRAPLSARDKNDETCIHIAAEHGHSIELLACLLDMDKAGVRQLKNSRGCVLPFISVCGLR